jgi:hypothetical protein
LLHAPPLSFEIRNKPKPKHKHNSLELFSLNWGRFERISTSMDYIRMSYRSIYQSTNISTLIYLTKTNITHYMMLYYNSRVGPSPVQTVLHNWASILLGPQKKIALYPAHSYSISVKKKVQDTQHNQNMRGPIFSLMAIKLNKSRGPSYV